MDGGLIIKGSDFVQISMWLFGGFGSIICFFFVRTLKQIDQNQAEFSLFVKQNFDEIYPRLRNLENFKSKIDVLHPQNHHGQQLND